MVNTAIKSSIRTIPNWPQKGVMFRDITTLFKNPKTLKICLDDFAQRYKKKKIDLIAGIDSRGFLIGVTLAYLLGKGFVLIRKKGKLPAKTIQHTYQKEYGPDTIEIHQDAVQKGQKVLLVDDLIATGGTALAACRLIEKLGAKIAECAFIIDLPELKGSQKLKKAGYKIYNQIQFKGK